MFATCQAVISLVCVGEKLSLSECHPLDYSVVTRLFVCLCVRACVCVRVRSSGLGSNVGGVVVGAKPLFCLAGGHRLC